MSISFLQILRKSSRLTLVNSAGVALNFLAASYAANKFGPDVYGRISFVLLWVSYAGLMRPGVFDGGQRQLINLLGRGDSPGARRVQNIGFSGDLLWNVVPAVLLLAASARAADPVRHFGFTLAPFLFLAQSTSRMLGGLFLAHQEFETYTAACTLRALAQPALLLTLIHFAGPQALLAAPLLAECGIALYYVRRASEIGIQWHFERATAFELMKVGLPLSLAAVAYWLYRLAGPTSIAGFLSVAALGVYAFASKIIDQVTRFFGDFSNVLMPGFWSSLARAGNPRALLPDISRLTVYLVLLACFACNLIQAVASFSVTAFLPRFTSSVPVLEILAFNTVLLTITMPAGLLLDSTVVNKQRLHVGIWAFGSALNYSVNYAVLARGRGIAAIAWNDIWVQIVVAALVYATAHGVLFVRFTDAWRFYAPLGGLLVCCASIFMLLRVPLLAAVGSSGYGRGFGTFCSRCLLVAAVWLPIAVYFRKRHRFVASHETFLEVAASVDSC